MGKTFKPSDKEDTKCAPSKKYENNSCFTLESLKRMATAYNKKIDQKKFSGKIIDIKDNKTHLVAELTDRLKDICDDQICWLKQDFVKELRNVDIQDKTFRPVGPQGRFTWLNTTNINEIMSQYEQKHSDFLFLGAVPIDFDSLEDLGIKNLNFDELVTKGKTKIGIIFNFDEHWKNGSHWVGMYSDLLKNQVYYFDSYGTRPNKRIRQLVHRISKWCYTRNILKNEEDDITLSEISFMDTKNPNYIEKKIKNIKFNQNRHQFKHSECGVYSVNFILRLLKGETFEYICNNVTLDDEVNKCRETYFRFK